MNDHSNIPVLQPITARPEAEAVARVQRFLELDTRPWTDLTAVEQAELRKMEDDLGELQYLNFVASIEAGDPESSRKAFFGSDYKWLSEKYEEAQEEEKALDRRCVREARNDDPPAWMEEA